LKGHSRVIALADYAAEKSFVLKVPHLVLFGSDESTSGPRNHSDLSGTGARGMSHSDDLSEPTIPIAHVCHREILPGAPNSARYRSVLRREGQPRSMKGCHRK
jgi:hypothetical protein